MSNQQRGGTEERGARSEERATTRYRGKRSEQRATSDEEISLFSPCSILISPDVESREVLEQRHILARAHWLPFVTPPKRRSGRWTLPTWIASA
jgi:hypothetical protein